MTVNHSAAAEYDALRATIRERGTMRLYVVWGGLAMWAALSLVVLLGPVPHPGGALIPLLLLVATFEINFFVHTGVERVGRYIQVFYEEAAASRGWETTAMTYGSKYSGGLDPLFGNIFFAATAINFATASAGALHHTGWMAVSALAHLSFSYRIVAARRAAATQRAIDLDRFRSLVSN